MEDSEERKSPVKPGPVAVGEEIMAYAKISLLFDHPYLSPAVWGVKIVPMDDISGTDFAAIDQNWRLYYIPKNWAGLSIAEGTTILYHELMHALRDHCNRAKMQIPTYGDQSDDKATADLLRWGAATDMGINDDLLAEGMVFPQMEHEPYAVFPNQFKLPDGELEEFYFQKLQKKMKVRIIRVGFGNSSCGSGADGKTKDYEIGGNKDSNGNNTGKDRSGNTIPGGLSQAEQEIIKRMVAESIKSRETVPEHWARWAEVVLNPKINWQAAFMTCIRNNIINTLGKSDYTYRKLPRRQDNSPFIFPALQGPRPKVVVVQDTSGSMGENELQDSLAEIHGILKATACEVTVMCVDAQVHTKQRVTNVKNVDLKGGGGTSMDVGIEEAEKLKPDFIVVLSDGITPWGKNPPKHGTKILIGLVSKPDKKWPTPSYARVFPIYEK